jgi:hypothetical protein
MHPSAVLSNKPLQRFDRSSDPDRLFAVSRGSADLTVLDTHPDQRTPWLLRIHGALAKHLHVGETAQLYALRDLRGQQVVVPITLTAPVGNAGLQLQVSTGRQKLTYELPTSGTTVQLRVRSGQLAVAGQTPDRVERLRTPVSGLQLTLLQRPSPAASLRVLDQQRLALSEDGDNVRLLVPGRLVGVVGKPGPTWLAFPTG